MKLGTRHVEEASKSAEEYRQAADVHAQELKSFWKRFAVSGLFVIAVVAIILACLAWFVMNNRAEATTGSLSAKEERYAITADGEAPGIYDSNVSGKLDTTDSMKVSATRNLSNYDGGKQLVPGSCGSLTFTVTPYVDDLGDITVQLDRYLVSRAGNVYPSVDTKSNETLEQLYKLLSGHIVFFEGNPNGFYEKPILNGTLTISKGDFEGANRTPVTRTVYWIWPEHFRDFVLTGGVNYEKNLFAATNVDGYSDLLADINGGDSWSKYFPNDQRPKDASGNDIVVKQDMSTADLQTCSDIYDTADEKIGRGIQYVQVRFTAQEAEANNG